MKKFLFLALILIPFLLVSCPDQNGREIDVAPRIVLIGPSEVFFNVNDTYVEYGYLATDVDGNDVSSLVRRDISSLNMGKEGSYQVSYVAVDRKGVKSDPLFRTVNVGDAFAPQISISGANPLLIPLNSDFSPPSASAFAYDGSDLSDSVSVDDSSVDTSSVGTYLVSYSVSDSSGVSGSASLFVYVLESSNPRIVLDGPGSSEDNPFSMQVQGSSALEDDIKAYIESTLPLFQAYDLEDGDISYKTALTAEAESSLVAALKADGAGAVAAYELTVSDSENNTGTAQFWILPQTDTEPPVLTIAGEKPSNGMYQIEVDMWNNNSSAWTELFNRMQIQVTDNSWTGGTTQTLTSTSSPFIIFEDGSSVDGDDPSAAEGKSNPITISISYISSNSESSNDLITTLNHDQGADLNLFDYNNPTSQVNIKQVSISAKDAANNFSAPLSISIQMTDSTPPVIAKKNISIPFASTGIESYNLSFRDNSGLTGTCSGLTNQVVDTSIAGPYKVTFTAADNSQPKNIDTYEIGSGKDSYTLTVRNPRERYTGGNCFFNGTFQGTNHPTVQGPEGLTALSPTNWNLCNWDDTSQASGARWRYAGVFGIRGTKEITGTTMADSGQSNEAICALIKGSSGRTAYMTCGCWNIATSTWISNVAVGIYYNATGSESGANVDGVLYNSVTYSLNYKSVTFLIDRGNGLEEGAKRHVTLTKLAGSGSFENESKLEVSYTAGNSDCSEESISAFMNNAKHSAWKTREGTFTVSGGNITSYRIHYGVQNVSDDGDDFGSLVSDIRIEPVKWKERETAGGEVKTRTYNISTGAYGWE